MDLGIVLIINPKNTSSKIAVYRDGKICFLKTIRYTEEQIKACGSVPNQLNLRKDAILKELRENDINVNKLSVIVARGGLVKPVRSGIYEVNDTLRQDLIQGVMGEHATNLGGIIAAEIAANTNARAFIVDPVVVDELEDVARISGHPLFERKAVWHALNQKNVARRYAKSLNRKYDEMRLIVAHAGGGGISVGAHLNGRVIDVNQAFDGEGPFALERAGTLPAGDLVKLCFSGKYSQDQIMEMITAKGGLYAYVGTTNVALIEKQIAEGDTHAEFILYAMAYQVAKEIGAMWIVLEGDVDAVILSGDIFGFDSFTRHILAKIRKMGTIMVYPNEDEMDALAANAFSILRGEAEILQYE